MRTTVKATAAYVTTLALLICISPFPVLASDTGARLEGIVVGVEGRPAAGATVNLIDKNGDALAEATATEDGIYSFPNVPAGEYVMGIQTEDGTIVPVAAAPLQLNDGKLARRDLKLVETGTGEFEQATANYGFGSWWAGLSGGAKFGVIVAFVAVGYGLYEVISDDDEKPASPETLPE